MNGSDRSSFKEIVETDLFCRSMIVNSFYNCNYLLEVKFYSDSIVVIIVLFVRTIGTVTIVGSLSALH